MAKDVIAKAVKGYIDIADISDFLTSKEGRSFQLDNHKLQIIEEVVFLCANNDFINDVENVRRQILKKFPKLNIPTQRPFQAERILAVIYEHLHESYKKSISELIEKYKLLPHLYWQDNFLLLELNIEEEFEDAADDGDRITKKEARARAVEKMTEDMELHLLDSIIIRNKPFDRSDGYLFWANPYFTRKTSELSGITIAVQKKGTVRLEIGFPPYATLPEMKKILKNSFKQIQEYREAHLPLLTKRDHRKDNLSKMIDAYLLDAQGKAKATIANILDKKYGGSISFEAITQLVKRIKKETSRFSPKQET